MSNSDETAAPTLMLCDCEGSMRLDADAIGAATGRVCSKIHTQLCRAETSALAQALADARDLDAPLVIACAQESAAFDDVAADHENTAPYHCVDLRDRAGWSDEAAKATPKIVALLAESALTAPAAPATLISSEGVCLVYGRGQTALDAATRLSERLAVTCLLLDEAGAAPRRANDFPILKGRINSTTGSLGGFEIRVDGFAEHQPGGRGAMRFAAPRDGARSACDLILDLSGEPSLFPAPEKRDGYLRADPRDPIAVSHALFEASQLSGEFDKPLYIRFEPSLCAHSRARKTGCERCLNLCPTGAITPNGDHVALDPLICAGCGACAAICPTGAASYDDPPFAHQLRRMRVLAETYRQSGGETPRLLIHDSAHGAEMIALAARYGRGLPADVLPLEMAEIGGVSHALLIAALALGYGRASLLTGPKSDRAALAAQLSLARVMAIGVGAEPRHLELLDCDDPDALSTHLYGASRPEAKTVAAPVGDARAVARMSLKALAGETPVAAPISLAAAEMPSRPPYGAVVVNTDACTLCLACVGLCPTGALLDNPDRPELRFQEDACVQCGICANTCPESAITLTSRLDLSDAALQPRVLHEEEPFACAECGALFGVKSTIERVAEKLGGQNWMYTDSDNLRLLRLCDNCRVRAQFHAEGSPFQMGAPRRPRTTEDYLHGDAEDEES